MAFFKRRNVNYEIDEQLIETKKSKRRKKIRMFLMAGIFLTSLAMVGFIGQQLGYKSSRSSNNNINNNKKVDVIENSYYDYQKTYDEETNSDVINNNFRYLVPNGYASYVEDRAWKKIYSAKSTRSAGNKPTNTVINGQTIIRSQGNYTHNHIFGSAIGNKKPENWAHWKEEWGGHRIVNDIYWVSGTYTNEYFTRDFADKDGHVEYVGWSFWFGGKFGKRSIFLNDWSYELLNHNGNQAWDGSSFSGLKYKGTGHNAHDDGKMKYKDFIWLDVINGERLMPELTSDSEKNKQMEKFYATPYNTGLDQEVEWETFLNTPFAFQPAGVWHHGSGGFSDIKYLNAHYDKDFWHGNLTEWRARQWHTAHHNWRNIPQMKHHIIEAYDHEFKKEALPRSKTGQVEGRVEKLYVWIPYYLTNGDDVRSFDFSETAIVPLEAIWNFYDKNSRENDINIIIDEINRQFSNYHTINIETDDGVSNVFNDPLQENVRPNSILTIDKFNNIINDIWSRVYHNQKTHINNWISGGQNNNGFIVLPTGQNTYNIYLKSRPGLNSTDPRIQARLVKENLKVVLSPSKEWIQWNGSKLISSRINVDPSYYFSYDSNNYYYKLDVPVQDLSKPEYKPTDDKKYLGRWIYHANATIRFTTTSIEDEILYINDVPVDVRDYNFIYELRDDIVLDKDNNKVRTNEYRIKIEKYKQVNGVNIKDEILSSLEFDIVIESYANDFDISYFAWDPKNNHLQQQLIEEFILDPISGEPLLDKDGNKIKNPKYNPLIDPKTGVIKQLVWVNKSANNNYLKFLPDPYNEYGKPLFEMVSGGQAIIDPDNFGFIAEAFVIPKGITIKDTLELFGGVGSELNYSIVEIGKKDINKWKSTRYGSNETYLSSSGIYLFTDDINNSLSTIKLVGFGGDESNSPFDLFTNRYVDNSSYGWQPFWDTYHGLHLKNYLYSRGYDDEFILSLGYQEVIHYWKNYVSNFMSIELDPNKKIIKPSLNETKIREYAIQYNKNDFKPDETTLRSWMNNFEYSNLVDVYYDVVDEFNVKFTFGLNSSVVIGNFLIRPEIIIVNLNFKDSPVIDPVGREKLVLDLDEKYINNIISNNTLDDYYAYQEGLFNKKLVFNKNQKLIDNLNFSVDIIDKQNLVKFSFDVIDKTKYYLDANDLQRYFVNNFIVDPSGLENIFKGFDETEFNVKTLNGSVDNIKKIIKEFVLKKVNSKFVLDKDYQIVYPSDEEIKKISIMRDQTFANPEYIVIGLRKLASAKPNYYGSKDLICYNYSKYIPNVPNNDLSNIKLNPLEYFVNDVNELKQLVVRDINNQLFQYKLVLFDSVNIDDFDNLIKSFFIRVGKKTINMVIYSLIDGINGQTSISITNTTNKAFDFDLSSINLANLNIQLVKPNDIKKAIENHLKINLYDKYGFEKDDFNIYYLGDNNRKIDIYSLEFMRMLVDKNPPVWKISKRIIISGNVENLKNKTYLVITNVSGKDPYDPDNDPDWLPPDQRPNNNGGLTSQQVSTIVSSVLGSIAFITIVIVILYSLRIYFRLQSKQIR